MKVMATSRKPKAIDAVARKQRTCSSLRLQAIGLSSAKHVCPVMVLGGATTKPLLAQSKVHHNALGSSNMLATHSKDK